MWTFCTYSLPQVPPNQVVRSPVYNALKMDGLNVCLVLLWTETEFIHFIFRLDGWMGGIQ